MDLDENTNVLDEVEILFKKLEGLPENVKRAAFNRIQQKLPNQEKRQIKIGVGVNEQKKRVGRKRKSPAEENGSEENKETDPLWISENSETEYIVEDVLTSRGRKAKRISYAYLNEYGKDQGEIVKKQRRVEEGADDKEGLKSTIKDLSSGKQLDEKGEHLVEVKEEEEATNNQAITEANETLSLENQNSEVVDDPASQEADVVIETTEKQIKIGKGVQGSIVWRKRKVGRSGALACQECSFVTSSKSLLDVHSRRHTGIKPYVCPDCGKAFPQSSGLNVHMKRHRGQRDYPCDYCEYKAYTKVDKLRHMTIHTGERNQICQYCGKAFAKDSTLREHVRSIHERPFKHICSECGFTTYRANNLRVHVRMRHRGEYNNHVCPVCGARVKQRNAFLEHMRAHTGEKPYRCDQCGSSFACLARLTVHRKSVHEPRQFPCTECRKTFQTKHHLLRHSVIHTKEKPFTCPFCTYSCNTQGNMTKHVKTIHHMPHFSYRKYRAEQESELSLNPEWVEKGQRVTEEYLKDLSSKLGRSVTLDELRERETEKQKRINAEAEQAKLKRMSRIHTPEHSYHSRPSRVKLEEEGVDPTTLILQVAAQNAESVSEEDQNNIVQVDLLPGIGNEEAKQADASHIVQMLSNVNSENSKVIHIQATDALQTMDMEDGNGEFETVIFANGEDGEFVPAQVFELCLNPEIVDGNAIQVLRPGLTKQEQIYDSEQPAMDFIADKEPDTVVVIINTDAENHNL